MMFFSQISLEKKNHVFNPFGYIAWSYNDQLPVDLILPLRLLSWLSTAQAFQWFAEVMGSNPVQVWSFQAFFFIRVFIPVGYEENWNDAYRKIHIIISWLFQKTSLLCDLKNKQAKHNLG